MRNMVWIVLSLGLPLGATPIISTPIQGTAGLGGTALVVLLNGEGLNIRVAGESGVGGLPFGCKLGAPCALHQFGGAMNLHQGTITGVYQGRAINFTDPAFAYFNFTSLTTFDSSTTAGSLTIPMDVSGQVVIRFPTTPELDLSIVGHGTDQVFLGGRFGNAVAVYLGPAAFVGTATEVPEPSTAALFALGAITLLAVLRRSYTGTKVHL